MLVLAGKIVIHAVDEDGTPLKDQIYITTISQIEIESSWREFTDTATITLPRLIDPDIKGLENKSDFRKQLLLWAKYHPQIEIWLGYGSPTHLAFKGIIREVNGRVPVVLKCEDDMYFFKQRAVSFASDNATLKDITSTFSKLNLGTIVPINPN